MDKQSLLAKIKDSENLTPDERSYLVELLNTTKKYGLVWEDKPEDAEELLRTHLPVLKEVVERRITPPQPSKTPPQPSPKGRESALNENTANLQGIKSEIYATQTLLFDTDVEQNESIEPQIKNFQNEQLENLQNEQDSRNLQNEQQMQEPTLPPQRGGLARGVSSGEGRGGAPNHILIEGDNLHALTALTFTHEGKVDVIYIDPPYNTGNKDFKYNDTFVDKEDGYRHSKWLSFMHKRLEIAKKLMKDTCVILISIDDNEIAPLYMLCNEIFGEDNFMANFIWRGGKRNAAKFISTSHEYMLFFVKNLNSINSSNISFKVKKEGLNEIYKKHKELVNLYKSDYEKMSFELKKWYKELPDSNPIKDNSQYCNIDSKGVYFASDISRGGGGGPKWDIINPKTGNIVKTPSRGWAYSKIEDIFKDIENDLIHFNDDGVPCRKSYLKEKETQLIETVFYKDRRAASKRFREIMGDEIFDFPKDEEIISNFIKALSQEKNAIILDFFAGSGTTLHATMQLNAEDGGNRQCILVTNNENNICEEVTYERNKRVIEGYTNAKGLQVAGLVNNNLRYYRTEFVPSTKTEQNKRQLTQASTDLLCIKEDCYTEITENKGLNPLQCRIFTNDTGKYMAVVYHSRTQWEVYAQLISVMKLLENRTEKVKLYAFSPEKETLIEDFVEVEELIEAVPLPEAIYNAYRATFRTLKLDKKLPAPNPSR